MSDIAAVMENLLAAPAFRRAWDFLEADMDRRVAEVRELAVISGAPFTEARCRAPLFRDRLAACGAGDCAVDDAGNALGAIRGVGAGPCILAEGHLDTVFPEDTPLVVTEKDGWLFCPGIGDDTAALGCLLSVLRAIRHAGLRPVGTLLFGGTAGEEGEGNSRGIRALLQARPHIDAVLSLESRATDYLCIQAVGIKRYACRFRGPGGHSWKDFGAPSPLHALGRATARLADLDVPAAPRTSLGVTVASGGTSINAIPQEAVMKIDLRSVSEAELQRLDAAVLEVLEAAVAAENARKPHAAPVTLETRVIGAKPAGEISRDDPLARTACAAIEAAGVTPRWSGAASTNQNIPVSLGIPALVLGSGGQFRNMHRLEESWNPRHAHRGAQSLLLQLFALAGLEGVSEPLFAKNINIK